MKRLAQRLLRLYPRAWRERYGGELAALLDEMTVTPRHLLDLAAGAAAAHRDQFKERRIMKSVPWLAVVSLLAAPLILVVVLVVSSAAPAVLDEGASEFFLLVAPLLVLPAVGALAAYYPAETPRANRFVRRLGLLAGSLAAVLALLSILLSPIIRDQTTPILPLASLFLMSMVGLGVWFLLNGWLGLRGGVIPWPLSLLSAVYGLVSMFTMIMSNSGVQAALPRSTLTSVANVTTPLWLLSFFVWMVGTAIWLIWHGRRQAGAPAVELS